MGKKYVMTDETINFDGHILHRIKRLSDGRLGGFIESESNLSQKGSCWIEQRCMVYENARVRDDAAVDCDAWGDTVISGNALIHDNAVVIHSEIKDNVVIGGQALVCSALIEDSVVVCEHAYLDTQCWGIHLHGDAKFCGSVRISEPVDIYTGTFK